jgi:hypothetical protein
VELIWLGGSPTTLVEEIAQRRLVFRGFAPQTRVAYVVGRHRLDKLIRLAAPGHPSSFRFAMRMAPGLTHELVGTSITVRDDQGAAVLRMMAPRSWDSSTTEMTVDGAQEIRTTITEGSPTPQGYPTFRLTPNPDDLDGATYPVFVDPTVVISGTGGIEDNSLVSGSLFQRNFGGGLFVWAGVQGGFTYHAVSRFDESLIPAGTIDAVRWKVYQTAHASSTTADTLKIHAIKDANDWVEGSSINAPESGASDWSSAKLGSQAWAGSQGCSTSGTDYDAAVGASEPYGALTSGPDVLHTISLPTQWATDWRDAGRVNNGLFVKSDTESTNRFFASRSTEAASNQPTFEVDYTVGAAPVAAMSLPRKIL